MLTLTELTEQSIINKRLDSIYGRHADCVLPRFRVVYSDETIRRHGEFNDYVEGTEIFLRTVKETRTVKKYQNLFDRWVVERLIPNLYSDVPGEQGTNYIYECMYAFPEGLPLNWRAVDFLIAHFFRKVKGQNDPLLRLPRNEKEMVYQEQYEKEKRKQQIRDMIDSTALQVMLHDKSAVGYTTSEEKK